MCTCFKDNLSILLKIARMYIIAPFTYKNDCSTTQEIFLAENGQYDIYAHVTSLLSPTLKKLLLNVAWVPGIERTLTQELSDFATLVIE